MLIIIFSCVKIHSKQNEVVNKISATDTPPTKDFEEQSIRIQFEDRETESPTWDTEDEVKVNMPDKTSAV